MWGFRAGRWSPTPQPVSALAVTDPDSRRPWLVPSASMDEPLTARSGTYWLDLFTFKSWNEFLDAGGTVSGFSQRRWSTVQKMKHGDLLLCYLTGVSRFIGVLEVTGSPFQDESPIWSDSTFPSRVPVRVVHQLEADTAVPVLELRNELSMFQGLNNPNYWSGAFRGSPAKWKPHDGKVVTEAVADAVRHPVHRPVDRSKLGHRPKTFATPVGEGNRPGRRREHPRGGARPALAGEDQQSPGHTEHTEIQGLLLKFGSAMGLDVWVARNDRNRMWDGRTFAERFNLLHELPHNFDSATSRVIELIDVLWLDGNSIQAAFEIEHTTSIYSGLLRMSDLVAMQPNLQIPLFIVAPDARRTKVSTEVNRPTFARMKTPLVQVCRFISFDALRDHIKTAGQWSRYMKPDVLQEISEACEVVDA